MSQIETLKQADCMSSNTTLHTPQISREGKTTLKVKLIFRYVIRAVMITGLVTMLYWPIAADRYVSEAIVLIQNTDNSHQSIDLSTLLTGGSLGGNKNDQLMLLEHLRSVDMLEKLDAKLDLRTHYNSSWDIVSRMWFKNYSMEWFHRHFLARTNITYDDYAGVLRIRTQAYDPQTAHAIASMLVEEGERYMNDLGHSLAREQVTFLEKQVVGSYENVLRASKILLNFQNEHKLLSPESTVASFYEIIGRLEENRTNIETQLAALPKKLDENHPTKKSLMQQLTAVEKQIDEENAKLASSSGKTLNSLVEEQKRLQLELNFATDIYKTALVGLEKGRMDAARTIKLVSILQTPTYPQYPWEPRVTYNLSATLIITLILAGIINLLKDVILDHVD